MVPLMPFAVATVLVTHVADVVPRLAVDQSCRAVSTLGEGLNTTTTSCMDQEMSARRELETQWPGFTRAQQQHCLAAATAGGEPSYVELQECLVMTRDAEQMERAERKAAAHGPRETIGASSGARP